jgi:hypothetical protein
MNKLQMSVGLSAKQQKIQLFSSALRSGLPPGSKICSNRTVSALLQKTTVSALLQKNNCFSITSEKTIASG